MIGIRWSFNVLHQPLRAAIQRRACLPALVIGSLLLGNLNALAESAMRTWTSAAGTELQAQFVEIKAGNIVLRGEKGERFAIRPADISAADREFVQKHLEAAGTAAAKATDASVIPAGSNTLATFKGGTWNGAAVVYTNQFFVFTMNKSGGWRLQILDKGQPVGGPLTDGGPGGSYYDKAYKKPGWKAGDSIGRTIARPLASFDKRPAQPLMQPASIEMTGLLADGVAFERSFTFNFNKVEYTESIRDPAGITYPTETSVAVVFPVSYKFESGTPWDAILSALEGNRLKIQPPKGNARIVEYRETLTRGEVRSLEAVGPWGDRKIHVDTPQERRSGRWGHLNNYANNEPYRGFSIRRFVVANGSTGSITITVE